MESGLGIEPAAVRQVLALSVVNAAIAFTVAETKLFKPAREWVRLKSDFLGELISCGYCFGMWSAFALVAVYQPRLFHAAWILDLFLTALVIGWLGAFQWVAMCWLMRHTGK